jgi:hypothetical protein
VWWIAVGVAAVVWIAHSRGIVASTPEPERRGGGAIRVEVLNGSNVDRAGLQVAEDLRGLGFDVVDVRNADRRDYEETIVLDRVGVPEYAFAVSRALHAKDAVLQRNDDLLLEVTVILGRDVALRGEGRS